MTAHTWLGLVAVAAVFVLLPLAYWWLEHDTRTGRQDEPPRHSRIDYRRY